MRSVVERLYLRTETRAILCAGGTTVLHAPGELRPQGPLAAYVRERDVRARGVRRGGRRARDARRERARDRRSREPSRRRGAGSGQPGHDGPVRRRARAGRRSAPAGRGRRRARGARGGARRARRWLEDVWGHAARRLVERLAADPLEARPVRILDAIERRPAGARRRGRSRRARGGRCHRAPPRRGARARPRRGARDRRAPARANLPARRRAFAPFGGAGGALPRRGRPRASAHPEQSWAQLARACGYSDQAHLVREFRAISGSTPEALARFGFFQSAALPPG